MIGVLMTIAVLICIPDIFKEQNVKGLKRTQEKMLHLELRNDIRHSVKRY